MIINEWQIADRLSQSVNRVKPADFRLWLAMLSPAIEEQAQFCWQSAQPKAAVDLREHFQLPPVRPLGMQKNDVELFHRANQQLHSAGLSGWRLQSLLQPLPTVVEHNAKKLPVDVKDNLSCHSLRHLQSQPMEKVTEDATILYDVLEALHA